MKFILKHKFHQTNINTKFEQNMVNYMNQELLSGLKFETRQTDRWEIFTCQRLELFYIHALCLTVCVPVRR